MTSLSSRSTRRSRWVGGGATSESRRAVFCVSFSFVVRRGRGGAREARVAPRDAFVFMSTSTAMWRATTVRSRASDEPARGLSTRPLISSRRLIDGARARSCLVDGDRARSRARAVRLRSLATRGAAQLSRNPSKVAKQGGGEATAEGGGDAGAPTRRRSGALSASEGGASRARAPALQWGASPLRAPRVAQPRVQCFVVVVGGRSHTSAHAEPLGGWEGLR